MTAEKEGKRCRERGTSEKHFQIHQDKYREGEREKQEGGDMGIFVYV